MESNHLLYTKPHSHTMVYHSRNAINASPEVVAAQLQRWIQIKPFPVPDGTENVPASFRTSYGREYESKVVRSLHVHQNNTDVNIELLEPQNRHSDKRDDPKVVLWRTVLRQIKDRRVEPEHHLMHFGRVLHLGLQQWSDGLV